MIRSSVKLALASLGVALLSFNAVHANSGGLLRKQSTPSRENEKRITEPNNKAASAVDALRATTREELAVTWNDRGTVSAVYGNLGNYGGATESAARVFLSRQSDVFQLRSDLVDLTLASDRDTPGGRVLDFQQDYLGVKVYQGVVSVAFDRDGNIAVTSGSYRDGIMLDTVTPNITAADARGALAARIRHAGDIEPIENELVVYVDGDGVAHLAYHIIQPTANQRGAAQTFETFVDALSSQILVAPRDINQYATGQVYKNGNAMAATSNNSLTDSSTVPSTAYQTVTLQGLTSSSGLVGTYCDTHTLTATANRAVPDGSGNYVYTRSTTVSTGSKFDATNTYYYVDDAQRYIQSLGFTNINNRSVRFQINGTTDDNSWYTPNSSGTGDLTTGSGGVDDAEDGEVMLHEYGHSIQDNSRPGAWSGAQPGAMGEGWGDYWAASVTSQRHNQRGTAYETTIMEWDASSYSSAVPPTIRSITSTKHYPENVQNEVHADGEMWSSTLWQIRSDFISLDGWPTGAQRADKVVLQSHFLVPVSGNSYANGSNALITAATNLGYTQAEIDAIRTRCVNRGFITGGGTAPAAPSGLTATATSSSQINLAWTDNANNETGFKIERKTGSGGTYAQIATVGAGVTTYSNTGLTASTAYYYRVRATNATGDSAYSNEANATTQAGGGGCSSSTTPITVGGSGSGSLATTDCTSTIRTSGTFYYDNFTFTAVAGTTYTITYNSTAYDCYLHLLNPSGTSVAFDDDGNGGTNSKIVYTPSAAGTYTIHCTSYSASAVGAYTVNLAGSGGGGGTELLTNGGFDTGTFAPWIAVANSTVVTTSPQAGTNCVKMLGIGSTASTNFYQSVAGFNGATKTLRFYLKMSSAEGTSTAYDYLYVRLKNTSGTTVSTLGTYSNRNKTTYANWTLVTLTVPASALTNYRIAFDATEDSSLQTTFYIDSVSVQ
ncbi:MAG TPA: M36 family metallopeptidase [Blastocatellia bacterium]|nr:M36 family metallopeptidase [Blastocatellia bacterium]